MKHETHIIEKLGKLTQSGNLTWYAHMPAWAHSGAYNKYVEITSEIYLMKPLGGEVNLR